MHIQVKLFVNEAHLFNDAAILFDVWPPAWGPVQSQCRRDANLGCSKEDMAVQQCTTCSAVTSRDVSASGPLTAGLLLMDKLWKEVLTVAAAN